MVLVVAALLASQQGGADREQVALEGGSIEAPDAEGKVDRLELATASTASTSSTTTSTLDPSGGVPARADVQGGAGPSEAPAEAPGPATSTFTSTTTTTTTVCINSFDPGCGALRWTNAVGANQPLTVSIEVLTQHPVAGQDVQVLLRSSDPDATPLGLTVWIGRPWETGFEMSPTNCYGSGTQTGYGSWNPPSPRPGSAEYVDTVRPLDAGTHRLLGCFTSSSWADRTNFPTGDHWCPGDGTTLVFEGWACADPYGSFANPILDFEVYGS